MINLSDEWVVIILEKELLDQKNINIDQYLQKLPINESKILNEMIIKIQKAGDSIFADKILVSKILQFPAKILIPIFIQMLNVRETGKHENCTFFAFLLKLAKINRDLVSTEVVQAIKNESAPYYYLNDLKKKLNI